MHPAELAANKAFGEYVQSIAFNLSLSRRMIEGLIIIRDRLGYSARVEGGIISRSAHSHFVPIMRQLERRGLVWHDVWLGSDPVPVGHQWYKLTRAGELTCHLLVEAGLIHPEINIAEVA